MQDHLDVKKNESLVKPLNVVLGMFLILNGCSGLLGGLMLLSDPSGSGLYLNIEWLKSTPFTNFFIPGIILLLFIGIGNTIGLLFLLFKKVKAFILALYLGLILIIWIVVQVSMIGYLNYLQPLYFSSGLIQSIIALFLVKKDK